ncbi:MAG: transcriptional regulator [Acidobacteriota bacterium]
MRRLLLAALGFLLVRWLMQRARAQAAGRRQVEPPRAGGRMVRDRVCDTFLPSSTALTLVRGGRTHYFCSARCRDRFLAPSSVS